MEIDRLALLEEILKDAGISERDDDEFTADEIAEYFGISRTCLIQTLKTREIEYTSRKALVDGRKRTVYRIVKDKE